MDFFFSNIINLHDLLVTEKNRNGLSTDVNVMENLVVNNKDNSVFVSGLWTDSLPLEMLCSKILAYKPLIFVS